MPPATAAAVAPGPEAGPKICEKGGSGLLLPLGGDAEQDWPGGIRFILYGLGLAWCFLGVAIIADVFMSAIEVITSRKSRKKNPNTNRFVTVQVWNPTVANLTLMALGSSAPEILLSVIELLGNNFFSGDLGPSTIVGSAAFNLLCITAVCVSAIPNGEHRKIKEMPVYAVTASFSVCAYLWLLVILMASSENVVEPWEGIVTFLMFPGLVVLAFIADRGYLGGSSDGASSRGVVVSADMTKEELAELAVKIRKEHGAGLTEEQVAKVVQCHEKNTRAQYRVAATRKITGSKRVKVAGNAGGGGLGALAHSMTMKLSSGSTKKVFPEEDLESQPEVTRVGFADASYAVLENAGKVTLCVRRSGSNENCTVKVNYTTRDGQATSTSDYVAAKGTLTFGPGVKEQHLDIGIVDDNAYEDDEQFFVDLYNPSTTGSEPVELGPHVSASVTIIDDDYPGVICFQSDTVEVPEDIVDKTETITVHRKNGCTGTVKCKYETEDGGAVAPNDFDAVSGTLFFPEGVTTAELKVKIRARGRYERTEDFRIILTGIDSPGGGAKFDADGDGGPERQILTVFIKSDMEQKARVDRLMSALAVNWDKAKVGHANWRDQFTAALYVNGGGDDEDGEDDGGKPSVLDWALHIITLPWKLLFALVPPTDYCGGWLCFCCSLGMIGAVTAIIGDIASLFGCVLGLPDEVTAITFVALGTSLPDTFASKTAATQDPYADASIGNVTGSNSVNVFLGLGLPWMIGAIYWRAGGSNDEWDRRYLDASDIASQFKDGAFIVKAGGLGFSVTVFSVCAVVAIIVLFVRRLTCQGELGGPTNAKYASSAGLVTLWLIYVALSSWYSISSKSD